MNETAEEALIRELKEEMNLDIVYEDSDVIVINKPVGLVVHPAHGLRAQHVHEPKAGIPLHRLAQ